MDSGKQKRTSRLAVAISAVFHGLIIIALVIFAAREGMLGKQLKKFAVTIVPKEKPPEKPKEKPPEPKPQIEPPKTVVAPPAEVAKPAAAKATPPPAATVAPSVAPPAAETPSFDFEGGKRVESSSDPNVLYKGFVEYTLRSHWVRPVGVADSSYIAEVEVTLAPDGTVLSSDWKKGSGDSAWDDSIKAVLVETHSIGRPPPKGFPQKVLVRFDVQTTSDISIE
jgi:hypothetical protein